MIQLRMADFNTSDTFTSVNQTSFHGSGRTWPACLSPPRVFMSGGRYTYMSWNLWLNRLFMAMVWGTWHDTWRSLAQVISGPSKVWQWFRAFICWYARFNLIRFRFRCHHLNHTILRWFIGHGVALSNLPGETGIACFSITEKAWFGSSSVHCHRYAARSVWSSAE